VQKYYYFFIRQTLFSKIILKSLVSVENQLSVICIFRVMHQSFLCFSSLLCPVFDKFRSNFFDIFIRVDLSSKGSKKQKTDKMTVKKVLKSPKN